MPKNDCPQCAQLWDEYRNLDATIRTLHQRADAAFITSNIQQAQSISQELNLATAQRDAVRARLAAHAALHV
jgi:hypothetical protein